MSTSQQLGSPQDADDPGTTAATSGGDAPELHRGIKSRHLFMITLAGVIGTGLFLGTGEVIGTAGPGGTIIAYLVGGVLLYFTMVCLGELSAARPVSGSFQAHASELLGKSTGFTIGWVYWLSWAAFLGLEFLSAGIVMQYWFPDTPTWVFSAIFIAILFALNLFTVRSFAETEFVLAAIKVLAVGLFIVLGVLAAIGVISMKGQKAPYLSNFTDHGGIFPVGIGVVFAAMMTVVYTFMGSEVMGVAAGETEDPGKAIPRAVRTIVFRLVFLYLGAVVILIALVPWTQLGLSKSPFVTVLDSMGIPYAGGIMNFVILIAILSVGNTGLYVSTRILWSLAQEKSAPAILRRTNKRGVPVYGLAATMCFGLLSLLASVVASSTLFVFLMSVSGVGGALCWIVIAANQYRFRRKYVAGGASVADLPYAAPFFPFAPIAVVVLNVGVFVSLAFDSTQRLSLILGLSTVPVCYAIYYKFVRPKNHVVPLHTPTA